MMTRHCNASHRPQPVPGLPLPAPISLLRLSPSCNGQRACKSSLLQFSTSTTDKVEHKHPRSLTLGWGNPLWQPASQYPAASQWRWLYNSPCWQDGMPASRGSSQPQIGMQVSALQVDPHQSEPPGKPRHRPAAFYVLYRSDTVSIKKTKNTTLSVQ